MYIVPSRAKATSGTKHLGSSPEGVGIGVSDHRLPWSRETWSPHEYRGLSTRLTTTRLEGLTGLRASAGELLALMSPGLRAPTLIGKSLPLTFGLGLLGLRIEMASAPAPTTSRATPQKNRSGNRRRASRWVPLRSGDTTGSVPRDLKVNSHGFVSVMFRPMRTMGVEGADLIATVGLLAGGCGGSSGDSKRLGKESAAGSWKPWVLSSPAEVAVPPP